VTRNRGRTVIGTPGWVYVTDLQRIMANAKDPKGASRWSAWRLLRALHAKYGPRDVQLHGAPPRRRWRARTEVVAEYYRTHGKTPEERVREIEARIADLQEELRERDHRIDALSEDLRELRDRVLGTSVRRAW
jgi:hypothetical protein